MWTDRSLQFILINTLNNIIYITNMSSQDQDLDKLRRDTVDMATRTSKDSTLNDLSAEARTVASDTQAFLSNLGEKVFDYNLI